MLADCNYGDIDLAKLTVAAYGYRLLRVDAVIAAALPGPPAIPKAVRGGGS
jgi:hypothetical protein